MLTSSPVRITAAAAARAHVLLEKAPQNVIGLRVKIKKRGCSGLSYCVEYAEERQKFEQVVEYNGAKFFIDPQALMFLLGTEIDYVEETLHSGFIFHNPNEKGRCGCGESFHV